MGDLLTGIGTIIIGVGSLGGLAAWRNARLTKSIVQGNGQGSVDKMLERVLDQQASLNTLLVNHLTDPYKHNN